MSLRFSYVYSKAGRAKTNNRIFARANVTLERRSTTQRIAKQHEKAFFFQD
jgi:hypothetical protein